MASFEIGFSRKLIKDFISRPKNEIIFMQAMHVFSGGARKTIGQQLLIDGEREIILPDECQVIGILDDSGENYIGAQRRDSGHMDLMPSLSHQPSVNSLGDTDLNMKNLQMSLAED
jgi:hypothetical protein